MPDNIEEFCLKLKRGPAVLFLGQDYLKLESGIDPFLAEILKKYGQAEEPNVQYGLILEGDAKNSIETSLAWMQQRCDRFSIPQWLNTVGEFAWNAMFCSAIDLIWVKAFRTDWREIQPVFSEKYKPQNERSRQVLNCTLLFGRVDRTEELERPPLTRLEFLRRKQVAVSLARRIPEIITPLGSLVIEGYGLRDWFTIEDLVPIIDALNPGQVFIFDATEALLSNVFISEFLKNGKITAYSETLASFLIRGEELGLIKLGAKHSEEVFNRQITIGHNVVTVPLAIWNQVSRSAQILNDAVFAPSTRISEERKYYEFRNFLSESGSKPVWAGYEKGFAFERDFEGKLLLEVERRLESGALQAEPVVLHGQTGTGKTVALGSLAFKVRKKRKYPVLFIDRRPFQPNFSNIDAFCKWAEDNGAVMNLILWDGMVGGEQYYECLQYLVSRGRKIVLVGTCYRDQKARGKNYIEAPATLSEKETSSLVEFLNTFEPTLGDFCRSKLNPRDGTFLVALYRLLPPTRSGIRSGLLQEIDTVQRGIDVRAKEIVPELRDNALAYALWKAKIIDDSQFFSAELKEVAGEAMTEIEELIGLVMVPGQFGLQVPLELLLRVLKKEIYSNFVTLLSGIDILRWVEDIRGNISLGPRHPLEAKLIVQARCGGAKIESSLARKLIGEIKDTGSSEDMEIQFAVELARNMGPNVPSSTYYAPFFKDLSETLTMIRESRSIQNPRLMLQEATLLRESIRTVIDFMEAEKILSRAEKIARDAAELLHKDSNKKLISAVMVELAAILGSKVRQNIEYFDRVDPAYEVFTQARNILFRARVLDPENFYAIDVLSWATRDLLKSNLLDEKKRVEIEADVLHAFFTVEEEDLSIAHRERLEQRRFEIAEILGREDLTESAFQSLRNLGSGAGYYLRASNMIGRLPADRSLTPEQVQQCSKAFNYLQGNRSEISKDGRCLHLLLRTWWMSKTGKTIFCGERQTLLFSRDDWQFCQQILTELLMMDEFLRFPFFKFLYGLTLFHLNNLEQCFHIFNELGRETDIHGRRRIIRSFLASDSDGLPMLFNGTVTWADSRRNRGEILVEELRKRITFIPTDFGRPEIQRNEALNKFHIAFNFIGPIADPQTFYKA